MNNIKFENTIWYVIYKKQVSIEQKNKNLLRFDMKLLEEWFGDHVDGIVRGPQRMHHHSQQKVSLIDARQKQNILIFLKHMKMKWRIKSSQLYNAIKELEYETLISLLNSAVNIENEQEKRSALRCIAIDTIEKLYRSLPRGSCHELTKAFQTSNGERSTLDEVSLFWIDLCDIDENIRQRLKLWHFSLTVCFND